MFTHSLISTKLWLQQMNSLWVYRIPTCVGETIWQSSFKHIRCTHIMISETITGKGNCFIVSYLTSTCTPLAARINDNIVLGRQQNYSSPWIWSLKKKKNPYPSVGVTRCFKPIILTYTLRNTYCLTFFLFFKANGIFNKQTETRWHHFPVTNNPAETNHWSCKHERTSLVWFF